MVKKNKFNFHRVLSQTIHFVLIQLNSIHKKAYIKASNKKNMINYSNSATEPRRFFFAQKKKLIIHLSSYIYEEKKHIACQCQTKFFE